MAIDQCTSELPMVTNVYSSTPIRRNEVDLPPLPSSSSIVGPSASERHSSPTQGKADVSMLPPLPASPLRQTIQGKADNSLMADYQTVLDTCQRLSVDPDSNKGVY